MHTKKTLYFSLTYFLNWPLRRYKSHTVMLRSTLRQSVPPPSLKAVSTFLALCSSLTILSSFICLHFHSHTFSLSLSLSHSSLCYSVSSTFPQSYLLTLSLSLAFLRRSYLIITQRRLLSFGSLNRVDKLFSQCLGITHGIRTFIFWLNHPKRMSKKYFWQKKIKVEDRAV